ncbi:MAG: glycosyltransferase family 4 protein [Bacilli bacterium]|nr:glycosyltransferase family 4 protein [Bacilli bacterium]
MRVGIFTDTYPPYINGVSTSIVMLKGALEKLGHEVFIVTVNNENMSYKYEDDDKIIRLPGIPIGIYDYRLTGIYPIRVINKIKNWNLDVIHSQTEFGVGTFARLIAKQFHIPLVHTYHTMYEDYVHYITKGYFNGTSKKIVEYLTKFYCDKTATELIVPTKKAYDLFKNKYKVDRNIHIIPTGIEIDRFYKEKLKKSQISDLKRILSIQNEDFVILFVGRLGKEKSVDVLIDGQKEIIKKYKNVKLMIVGDGPDMEYFKKMVSNYKLENNVIFTGKVPYDDIPIYYGVADVFATASQTETQGLTVIEAMAASLPVLAIDDDSFRLTVVNDLNGYLFKDLKEYIKHVYYLIENPKEYSKIKKQARVSADVHSSKYFAERVLDVYKIAIETNNGNKDILVGTIEEVIKRGLHGK